MSHTVLFLTNTYFQLIVALRLRQTTYRGDTVDLVVTDHSLGGEAVAARLRKLGLFREVYFVRDRAAVDDATSLQKVMRYLPARLFPKRAMARLAPLGHDYDILLFNNANLVTHLIWHNLRKQVKCLRFEEGFSTYTKPLIENPISRRLLGLAFGSLQSHVDGLYLFHPEYYTQEALCPIFPIEPLDKRDEPFKRLLNTVFDYDTARENFDAPYIFLEESFRASAVPTDDLELVAKIADAVGRDRLIVKQHPRSPDERFSALGIRSTRASGIPWELIQMNENLTNATLLTISSGSALASALYFHEPVHARLLYRLTKCKPPMLDDAYLAYLARVLKDCPYITVPDSAEVFFDALRDENHR